MMDDSGVYLPDILPEADRRGLLKYLGASPRTRFGLGEQVAVLVVDMTRGFVEDRFRMGWETTGVPCARNILTLLEFVRQYPIPVFFTRPYPAATAVERGMWDRGVPGATFQPQPAEAYDIYPLLKPVAGEVLIDKQKPSAFFGTALHAMLTYRRVDTLIVTGMVTSGCIRATVNDGFSSNFRCTVPIECVADRAQLSHEVELVDMSVKYADVLRLDVVLADLKQWVVKTGL